MVGHQLLPWEYNTKLATPIRGASYYKTYYKKSEKLAANWGHLLKNEGNGKKIQLQPRGKLLEQALHKLPTRDVNYCITHCMSQEHDYSNNFRTFITKDKSSTKKNDKLHL
jgi:hypothetical protein